MQRYASCTHQLILRNASFELGIAPAIGGSLTHFTQHDRGRPRHWFRPAGSDSIDAGDVLGMAHFPLVPLSGRIARGVLHLQDGTFPLPRNDLDTGLHYLHGEGWRAAWEVAHASARRARLELSGPVRDWPFRYQAWQEIELLDEGLRIAMGLRNADTRVWPAGIGLHPWFAPPAAHLRAQVRQVWLTHEDLLLDRVTDVPERWRFTAGRALADSDINNGFSGWDGEAVLYWPGDPLQLRISATGALRQHLVIFTRHISGAYCVEPVSHAVDAFNQATLHGRDDTGAVFLAPGECLEGEAIFRPEASRP